MRWRIRNDVQRRIALWLSRSLANSQCHVVSCPSYPLGGRRNAIHTGSKFIRDAIDLAYELCDGVRMLWVCVGESLRNPLSRNECVDDFNQRDVHATVTFYHENSDDKAGPPCTAKCRMQDLTPMLSSIFKADWSIALSWEDVKQRVDGV